MDRKSPPFARLRALAGVAATLALAGAATTARAQFAPSGIQGHYVCHIYQRQTLTPDHNNWTITHEDKTVEIDVTGDWSYKGNSWAHQEDDHEYLVFTNYTVPNVLSLTISEPGETFTQGSCKK